MTATSTPEVLGGYVRTGDVASLLHVSPKTVARWAKEGRLTCVRTLGGHRRYRVADLQELINKLDRGGPQA